MPNKWDLEAVLIFGDRSRSGADSGQSRVPSLRKECVKLQRPDRLLPHKALHPPPSLEKSARVGAGERQALCVLLLATPSRKCNT